MKARIDEITRNPQQPRTYFDAAEMGALGKSLQRRQQQPLTVIPFSDPKRPKIKWMINDGERRFRAAQKAGIDELWIVVDDVEAGDELHTASFAANWNRAGHTHSETAHAIERERKTGKTFEEIAAIVGKSTQWAVNEHSLLKLDPELLKLMDPPTPREDRLPIKSALALVKLPLKNQMPSWRRYGSKPASEAFHHIRVQSGGGGTRAAGDDARYVKRRVAMAAGILGGVATLPGRMLAGLTDEVRRAVSDDLRALAATAGEVADLMAPIVDDEE